MAYLTKIILPNNLRSESLRSEFLELGQNYNNNHSSEDPLYDKNSTTLKFKFEVRDAETRSTVYEITNPGNEMTVYGEFDRRTMFFKQLAKFSMDAGAVNFLVHKNLMYKSPIKKNYEHVVSIQFE